MVESIFIDLQSLWDEYSQLEEEKKSWINYHCAVNWLSRDEWLVFQQLHSRYKHKLCPNSEAASFEGHIWRLITPQRSAKAVLIRSLLQMHYTNEAFFSLFLQDTPLLPFVASNITRFFACCCLVLKKKKMAIKWRRFNNGNNDNITVGSNNKFTSPNCDGKGGNIWWRN